MKAYLKIATFLVLILNFGCNDKESDAAIVPDSSGKINNLLVVVDNLLWEENIGESVREILAAPVQALNQEEPLFTISQMPTQVFSGFAAKNRIVLKIEKSEYEL